jgi:hypothetical protein
MIQPWEPPDAKVVRKYFEHLDDMWRDAHTLFEKLDSFYFRTYSIWPPEERFREYPVHRPSTPTWIVDHAADTQLAATPVIHRPTANRRGDAEERADRIENGLAALMNDAFLQEPVIPVKGAKKQLVLYGYTPIYGPFLDLRYQFTKPEQKKGEDEEDYDARIAEWEARRYSWNPLRIRSLHPSSVLLDPFDKVPAIGLRHYKVLAYQLADLTSRKFEQLSNYGSRNEFAMPYDMDVAHDPYEPIEVIEWWTASWHALVLKEGDLLYKERNGWGFQPLSHTFSSYGQIPTSADTVNPKYLAKGILEPNLDEIVHEAQQQTAKHELLMRAAFARRGFRGDASEAAEMMKGDILEGDKDDWWIEQFPNLPAQIFELGRETQVAIQRGSFSLALAGFRQEGVTTVGQQAILDSAAKNKFRAIEIEADHLFSILGSNMLRLAAVLKEELGITSLSAGGAELRAEDIQNNYRVLVEFRDVDPVLLQQQTEIALREYQAGLLSDEDYYTATGKQDVTGMLKRRIKEMVRKTPEYLAISMGALSREMGMRGLATKLEAAGKEQGEGLVDPQGNRLTMPSEAPPTPGAAPPMPGAAPPMPSEESRSPEQRAINAPGEAARELANAFGNSLTAGNGATPQQY